MKIALVDDDAICGQLAEHALHEGGYGAEIFTSVGDFKRAFQRDTFDMIFLDWVMPEMTGIEVLTWLQQSAGSHVPVIMISAKADSADIAEALEAGADDYVVKPLDSTVLLARVNALVRRTYGKQRSDVALSINGVVLNPHSGQASVNGEAIELTTKEFELAHSLFKNLGRPLSRSYLLETLWGKNRDVITRTLDAHISKIRRKLDLRPENGFVLQTIYGYGYRLELVENGQAPEAAGQRSQQEA